jgi:Mrp family chromosome partitioning ATPase
VSESCKSCKDADGCTDTGSCPDGGQAEEKLSRTLSRIKHKIVVLSGKGGVGKSTMATNIAYSLALSGKKVGLLDVDVHGPSVPRLLSMQGVQPHIEKGYIEPLQAARNLLVMSLGFMIPDRSQAVIWRGPVKMGMIRQFIEDVAWGDLDYLVVDCPPGTGDEPLSVLQLLGSDSHAVVVTTPQGVAVDDVRRSVSFVRQVEAGILGVVENMSGFACPDCGKTHDLFGSGGGRDLAEEMGVPFLGAIPMDPDMARSGDEGFAYIKVYKDSATSKAVADVVKPILALEEAHQAA